MRRHLLGIIALGFILSGTIGLFYGYSANSQAGMAAGVGLRAGLVLGALWMAFPQILQIGNRFPPWVIGMFAVGGLCVVIRPRNIIFVAPAMAIFAALQGIGWLIKPLPKKNGAPAGESSPPRRKLPAKRR